MMPLRCGRNISKRPSRILPTSCGSRRCYGSYQPSINRCFRLLFRCCVRDFRAQEMTLLHRESFFLAILASFAIQDVAVCRGELTPKTCAVAVNILVCRDLAEQQEQRTGNNKNIFQSFKSMPSFKTMTTTTHSGMAESPQQKRAKLLLLKMLPQSSFSNKVSGSPRGNPKP